MKHRMIELIKEGKRNFRGLCPNCDKDSCEECENAGIANWLLENGVIALPLKVGEIAYADIGKMRDGSFADECVVKCIEWDSDWDEPLYTLLCRERADYRTYWLSEYGREFFKYPVFSPKKRSKR